MIMMLPQHEDRGVQITYGLPRSLDGKKPDVRVTDALGNPAAIENSWGSG